MHRFARWSALAALTMSAALLPNAVASAAGPAQASPIGVTGHWSDQRFAYDVRAINTGSGVRGIITFKNVNTGNVQTASVTQLVPPSGIRDFFCVTGTFPNSIPPGSTEVLYLKDGGNGPNAVDQWIGFGSGGTGGGQSCATTPDPPTGFQWQTLTPPDFIAAIPAGG